MNQYADIAFPTAVRRCFTYRIPDTCDVPVLPGMRVWVPLRNQMAIGMVIRTHSNKPDFETREIVRPLDKKPVLSNELLKLTDWVHRFYYSGIGEAIQVALPTGMNFIAEPRIRPADTTRHPPIRGMEREIYLYLHNLPDNNDIAMIEIAKRWEKKGERAAERLVRKGLAEIWQIPRIRLKPQMKTIWKWRDDISVTVRQKAQIVEVSKSVTDGEVFKHAPDGEVFKKTPGGKMRQNVPDEVLLKNVPDAEVLRALLPSDPVIQKEKLPKWVCGLLILFRLPLPASSKEILDHPDITPYIWKRIQETGLLESREVPADQVRSHLPYEPDAISALNDHQQEVFEPIHDAVRSGKFHRFLLYGVTGSGKTEVYIHALRETLQLGRGGLVLVPEIALTPQTVRRFYRIFGDNIAVLHSRLSERERYDAWTSLQNGEKKVAIGARSAIFAPIQDPGLIIIDEEHDSSYKQEDPAPRYHARETAVMRAYYNNAVMITGSATPSLVSLRAAATKKCTMLKLDSRHALAQMPEVNILDLKQYRNAMRGPLAIPLFLAIEEALSRKEQVILLHNRRGFSTFIQCGDCGLVLECPHCSVSLTYHKSKKHLRCHYCGFSRLLPEVCPSCDSRAVGDLGMGTQKVEAGLTDCFPKARIARMDQDTTSWKGAHEAILNRFSNGEADILMGTQIVAKGLDFPNVTVVGVINSDTELAFPSYRSSERMYQLLSQVAGRSGRGEKPGKVFLQTLMPEHSTLRFARHHDFPGFARHEMKSRRELEYPPYSRLVKIFFKSTDAQLVADIAELFTEIVKRFLLSKHVLGPSPSAIARMNRIFSWESHVKIPPEKGGRYIEQLFDSIFEQFNQERPTNTGKVRVTINVDTMH